MTLALPKRGFGDFTSQAMTLLANAQAVFGWGNNATGALANASASAVTIPLQQTLFDPNTTMPFAGATVVDWAFTNGNLYVVFSDGTVYSAGDNTYGQLGKGDNTARPYLSRIDYFATNGITVQQVWAHGAAADTNGGGCVYFQTVGGPPQGYALYACGANATGNLGNGGTTALNTPTLCTGINTIEQATNVVLASPQGNSFSAYVLTADGQLWVAGGNTYGQLGITANPQSAGFTSALTSGGGSLTFVRSISATGGDNAGVSALALDYNGNVWTSGYGGSGQLGLNSTGNVNRFNQINPSYFNDIPIVQAAIGGGYYGYSYAIDEDGGLWTWGYNAQNNLFLGRTTNQLTPASNTAVLPAGTVASVFFPREEGLGANVQLFALLTNQTQIIYAGLANGQNGVAAPGGNYKYIPLPPLNYQAGETIQSVYVHGTSTTQRLFVLTSVGNLYSFGANTTSVCTGGYSSDTMPTSVDGFNIAPLVPNIPLM